MAASSIAKLSVLFTSDSTGFDKNIKKSLGSTAKQFAAWGKMVAGAGVAAGVALGAMVKATATAADSLSKTSQKLGVTIDQLAGLRHAGEQTGVSMQTMDMAVQRMTRRIAEAAIGTGEAKGAIEELGLSAVALNKAGPAEAMKAIAEAMKDVENQGDKVRLAMKLFDSEGVALVNTLDLGADGLREMQQEAVRLGISFSEVDAQKFVDLNDDLDVMRKQVVGLRNTIALELIPVIEDVGGIMGSWTLSDLFKVFIRSARLFVAEFQIEMKKMTRAFHAVNATLANTFKATILKFPGITDAIIAGIEFTINGAILGINTLIRAALKGMDKLNAAVSFFVPGVNIPAMEGSFGLTPVSLGRSGDMSDILERFTTSEAAKVGKLTDEIKGMEDEAARLASTIAVELVDVHGEIKQYTELTVEEIERAGGAGGKAAQEVAKETVEAMEESAEAAARAAEEMRRPWLNALTDMGDGLGDLITTGRTQWKNFGAFVEAITLKMVADYIVAWAEGMVKKAAMEMVINGTGSSIGWVSGISKLFAGPQSSGSGNLTGLARGGSASGGVPYIVGERGPEIMVPGASGHVMPNHAIGGAGGGGTVVVNQNFATGVSEAQLYGATQAVYQAALSGVSEKVSRGGNYRRSLQG